MRSRYDRRRGFVVDQDRSAHVSVIPTTAAWPCDSDIVVAEHDNSPLWNPFARRAAPFPEQHHPARSDCEYESAVSHDPPDRGNILTGYEVGAVLISGVEAERDRHSERNSERFQESTARLAASPPQFPHRNGP